jgi:hypothetical protein
MEWPGSAPDADVVDPPQLRIGPTGRLEASHDLADSADDRFEAVCAELGILLARRVEPVSARVLPFGREQLAMVQLRDGTDEHPTILTATAHGTSRRAAVAEAAIDAMTGGASVLAAALPSAVAEGKVRTAVVFTEGESPVRWGSADDEARLAALYAVVPQLGTFTAAAGSDTFRVLRLPGIGVSLVSDGPSAAAWVEGWFSALIHATQFALRPTSSTGLVATGRASAPLEQVSDVAKVREELEAECRRILDAAQEQARQILEAAQGEARRADEARREERERLDAVREAAALREREAAQARDQRLGVQDRRLSWRAEVDDELERVEFRRTAERARAALLEEVERERTRLLAQSRQDADVERRNAEQACAEMLASAKREAERLLRDSERARGELLGDARRESKDLRREAARARREAEGRLRDRKHEGPRREDAPWVHELLVGEARRAAEDVLHEARRTAEEIVRDAARVRQLLVEESRRAREIDLAAPMAPAPTAVRADVPGSSGHGGADARAAEVALLTAAATSVSSMASLLSRMASTPHPDRGTASGAEPEPLSDLPGLFFGA